MYCALSLSIYKDKKSFFCIKKLVNVKTVANTGSKKQNLANEFAGNTGNYSTAVEVTRTRLIEQAQQKYTWKVVNKSSESSLELGGG